MTSVHSVSVLVLHAFWGSSVPGDPPRSPAAPASPAVVSGNQQRDASSRHG